ncbi:biotin--[acetyl-CoA-carboxylase] ligase [Francisella sp. Scap27]|uniref:biotin--[acetyl-CoA-carboxylase] ligase n=1 Tax=Francisella sp. Scap27 TaxID=2589986 RepID=UPI0015BD40FD|nr:biotin--[acetyl-CoA-carboxylase] ligase [Francisella sp. Scap27]QLE79319.1 biotin--[acetyl-CoA-carboxylase] ligase [Francisella sp. Scap27]
MNQTQLEILNFLKSDEYISGAEIGEKLNISRAAISKNIKLLNDKYQLEILSSTKKGYLLQEKLDLLDIDNIIEKYKNVIYFHSIDSTSNYAIKHQNSFLGNTIILAEHQTKGYGRFNREWVSPFGKNLYCTIVEYISFDISKFSGLSLIIAISIAKVLQDLDFDVKLKWPNDIYINDKKVAGVIINISGEINNESILHIAFGLNVNMQKNDNIKREWTSLKRESSKHIDRTVLLIKLIETIKKDIGLFYKKGFIFFKDEYEKLNYIKDKKFTIMVGNQKLENCKYVGLSDIGEIIVEKNNQQFLFSSGEISFLESSIKSK